jgi:hypothetical protein
MLQAYKSKRKLQNLIDDWGKLRDVVLRAEGVPSVLPSEERRFLELKGGIAARLTMLDGAPRSLSQEAQNISQLMTGLLNRYERLDSDHLKSEQERAKFESFWHQCFVFLSKLKGVDLADASPARSAKAPIPAPAGVPRRRIGRSIPGAWAFRFVLRVAVIAVAVYLLGRAFGLRWSEEAGGFMASPPSSFRDVGRVLAEVGGSLWRAAAGFLSPVVGTYGPEATIVMVGVLLLGIGYWIFVRSR